MQSNFQQRVISELIQDRLGGSREWPFGSALDVEGELNKRSIVLARGEYLVIGDDRSGIRCGVVTGLRGLADYPRNSLVVSYYELERAFYEQYSDWGEV